MFVGIADIQAVRGVDHHLAISVTLDTATNQLAPIASFFLEGTGKTGSESTTGKQIPGLITVNSDNIVVNKVSESLSQVPCKILTFYRSCSKHYINTLAPDLSGIHDQLCETADSVNLYG